MDYTGFTGEGQVCPCSISYLPHYVLLSTSNVVDEPMLDLYNANCYYSTTIL
jgi:hypothetical protein